MKSMKHSGMSYEERNKGDNFAEDFFEDYCKNHYIRRIGFDEKKQPVNMFYNLPIMIRNIPDYYVIAKGKSFLCNVKGTDNIKQKEREIMADLYKNFSNKDCQLIYAFCFKENNRPIFKSIGEVMSLYDEDEDKQWHDGVVYRNLKLRKVNYERR